MTASPVWACQIQSPARLIVLDRESFENYLRANAGDSEWELVVRKRRSQRSVKANAYYWAVVVKIIADYCGYETDEMHEALAMRFLRIEDDPITGAPRRRRTPETNTAEFSEYVEQCKRFGMELGLNIPEANEVDV